MSAKPEVGQTFAPRGAPDKLVTVEQFYTDAEGDTRVVVRYADGKKTHPRLVSFKQNYRAAESPIPDTTEADDTMRVLMDVRAALALLQETVDTLVRRPRPVPGPKRSR